MKKIVIIIIIFIALILRIVYVKMSSKEVIAEPPAKSIEISGKYTNIVMMENSTLEDFIDTSIFHGFSGNKNFKEIVKLKGSPNNIVEKSASRTTYEYLFDDSRIEIDRNAGSDGADIANISVAYTASVYPFSIQYKNVLKSIILKNIDFSKDINRIQIINSKNELVLLISMLGNRVEYMTLY